MRDDAWRLLRPWCSVSARSGVDVAPTRWTSAVCALRSSFDEPCRLEWCGDLSRTEWCSCGLASAPMPDDAAFASWSSSRSAACPCSSSSTFLLRASVDDAAISLVPSCTWDTSFVAALAAVDGRNRAGSWRAAAAAAAAALAFPRSTAHTITASRLKMNPRKKMPDISSMSSWPSSSLSASLSGH